MLDILKKTLRPILPEPIILLSHKLRAIAAALWYSFPSSRMTVIGVTGTNGKTTTVNMIADILEHAGKMVCVTNTVEFRIGTKRIPNRTKMTVISPFLLQKFLKDALEAGCSHAVIETTSHAIRQFRNWGIKYDTVVLTNITHDHLDYHKNYQEYRDTKARLFSHHPRVSVINAQDNASKIFLRLPASRQITYGIDSPPSAHVDVVARKVLPEASGTMFTAVTPIGQVVINLKTPGNFNVLNALAAVCVGMGQGIKLDVIKLALERFKPAAGRMEKIDEGQPFTVIVDYAHTPDAFEQIYQTLRPVAKGKIIHVFGATGDRDKTKRPILGAIAGRFADYIIVTDEDPYHEDPMTIIEEVAKGVPRGAPKSRPKTEGKNFWKILDRREAIAKAFSLAKRNDIVLLTGKGHEEVMVVGDKHMPYSDRRVAREELTRLMEKK